MIELPALCRTRPRSALVVGMVLALAGTASATPHIDLSRCIAFDELALRRAILHELTSTPSTTRDFTVVVTCPDLVTASAVIDPQPGDGPLKRDLNLGEVPGDLRVKLLALAIAELVDVAAASAPPIFVPEQPHAPDPPGPTPKPKVKPPVDGASDVAKRKQTATERTDGSNDGAKRKRVATDPSDDPDRIDDSRGVVARAPATHYTWAISPRIGARIYPATPRPLVDVGAEVSYARFRLGIEGAVGQRSEALGTMRPYLATASLARELLCGHSLCTLVRIAGGLAGVSAEATAGATAHSAMAAYGEAVLAVEWSHAFDGWSLVAAVDGGWAEGLIAQANGVDAVQLAGLTFAGSLGARWQ